MQSKAAAPHRLAHACQRGQVAGSVGMVVGELAKPGHPIAATGQGMAKAGRVADAAKRGHRPVMERFAAAPSPPVEESNARGRAASFPARPPAGQVGQFAGGVPARRRGSRQSARDKAIRSARRSPSTRLAERAAGKDMAEAERLQGVQQDDVQVAGDAAVLEGVVQDDRPALELADRLPGRRHAIGILQVGDAGQPGGQFPGLVVLSRRRDCRPAGRPYPRLTTATGMARSRNHWASQKTRGVLPVPPG